MDYKEASWSLAVGVILQLHVGICMKVTMPDGFYFLGWTAWRACHSAREVPVIGGRSKQVGKV